MKLLIGTLIATALACTTPTDPPSVPPVAPVNQTSTSRVSPRSEHTAPSPGWATDPTHDTATMVDNESAFAAPVRPPIMIAVPPHMPAPPNCPSCR